MSRLYYCSWFSVGMLLECCSFVYQRLFGECCCACCSLYWVLHDNCCPPRLTFFDVAARAGVFASKRRCAKILAPVRAQVVLRALTGPGANTFGRCLFFSAPSRLALERSLVDDVTIESTAVLCMRDWLRNTTIRPI